MATFTRQPFGEISTPRLQALGSSKNRQNAVSPSISTFACPLKHSAPSSVGKRRREPEIFEDEDCENADPALLDSPSKKSRPRSHDFVKPARFAMVASPARPSVSLTASPAISQPPVRKAISSPNTAKSTPISRSRGSPKNKRLSAISKRRASSSPFRRVDPPSFSQGALPFSIDAALSGTISNYTPKSTVTATPTPASHASAIEESMPKSWFFEIHEDTPEQEAANVMEHSASVLDISSDDDALTKAKIDEMSRGKENIPPPNFTQRPIASPANPIDEGEETAIEEPSKHQRLRKSAQDAMDEDRRPLGDLKPSAFYAVGCDASSYVTVDAGIERPSRLSRQLHVESVSEEAEPVNKDVECAPAEEVTTQRLQTAKSQRTPSEVERQATPTSTSQPELLSQ